MKRTANGLSIEISASAGAATKSINRLTKALVNLKAATADGAGLNDVKRTLDGISLSTVKLDSNGGKSLHTFYHKLGLVVAGFTMAGRVVGNWIRQSNNYVENLNLFNVAMGEYAEEAMGYAEQVESVMGIDISDWIRNQGVFMTLTKGFGVVGDRAYLMSKNLTQLGYDISSFFNISVEDAMQKLQSGISGELEPLRRLGYDLSQARLEAIAYSLGIDKAVSSMTQAEKAELRYVAIMTQVTDAQGDMARTLNAPANQLRILKASINQAARELGNVFIPLLNATLPYLIAAAKAVRILAASLASFFGFELPDSLGSISSSIGDIGGGVGDITDGLNGASGAAKDLKGQLAGFDEINIISNDTSGGGGGGGGIGGGGGFDFNLDDYNYDFIGDAVETKIDQILDRWMPKIEWIKEHINQIVAVLGTVAGILITWKFATGFAEGVNALTTFLKTGATVLGGSAGGVAGSAGWLGALSKVFTGVISATVGFSIAFNTEANDTDGSRSAFEALKIAIGNAMGIGGAALTFMGLGVGGALSFGLSVIIAAAIGIAASVTNHKKTVQNIVKESHAQEVADGVRSTIEGLFSVETVAEVGLLPQTGALDHEDYTELVNQRADAYRTLNWETENHNYALERKAYWENIHTRYMNTEPDLLDKLGYSYSYVTEKIDYWSNEVASSSKEIDLANDSIKKIDATLDIYNEDVGFARINTAGWNLDLEHHSRKAFDSTGRMRDLTDATVDYGEALEVQPTKIDEAKKSLGGYGDEIDVVKQKIGGVTEGIEATFNGSGAGKSFASSFISTVKSNIKANTSLAAALKDALAKLTLKLKFTADSSGFVKVRAYASGGFPEAGQLFLARESGAGPEMVGTMGGRTAVANNDQIVEGIASGVAAANAQQNALLAEQNTLLRAILSKTGNGGISGREIHRALNAYDVARGSV